jgi:hypothetical protein
MRNVKSKNLKGNASGGSNGTDKKNIGDSKDLSGRKSGRNTINEKESRNRDVLIGLVT